MFETTRLFILGTFSFVLFTAIFGIFYAKVPSDFAHCKQVYKIQSGIPFLPTKPPFTKKEKTCIKSREDLDNFDSCLAGAALKNQFPITVLSSVGKVSELRKAINLSCVAVVF